MSGRIYMIGKGISWSPAGQATPRQTRRRERCTTSRVKSSSNCPPMAQPIKTLSANAGETGDVGLIPGLGRSPEEANGKPL